MNTNATIPEENNISFCVTQEQAGLRIDVFLTQQLPVFSRSLIKKLLTHQQVIINHSIPAKPSYVIKYNDTITLLSIPTPTARLSQKVSDDIGITIVYQHEDFIIINKPAGIVVHPPEETFTDIALTDWIVQEFPQAAFVGDSTRPGIVHRLDRNTSGIMIVALNNEAHHIFTQLFKDRKVEKIYQALVVGHPPHEGTIDFPIGRHPIQKNIMHCFTSTPENSTARDALTFYKVLTYFDTFSHIELKPKTGRTHQIRVHCKAIGHPLLGDTVYGTASKKIAYHALHAIGIAFTYKNKEYTFSTQLNPTLQTIINTSKPVKTDLN